MFEETLLIIKNDYLPKRKFLLIKLLGYGFQIQTNRRVLFTPELAAQFYGDNSEESNFMLQVILLSKGPSEAFILTMENAVEQLKLSTICYFCTSVLADRQVHVSKTLTDACREIKFIFPNYICEPIPFFDKSTFCHNKDISSIIGQVYDIMKTIDEEPKIDWKIRLAEWIEKTNKLLPIISNECSTKSNIGYEEKFAQTKTSFKDGQRIEDLSALSLVTSGTSPGGSSGQFTSSSRITQHRFESSSKSDNRNICNNLALAKMALSKADVELQRENEMKPQEEEEICEELVCETDVEYIVLHDEATTIVAVEEEHVFDEQQGEEIEIKEFADLAITSSSEADLVALEE